MVIRTMDFFYAKGKVVVMMDQPLLRQLVVHLHILTYGVTEVYSKPFPPWRLEFMVLRLQMSTHVPLMPL